MKISIIVAMNHHRVIGSHNQLPWHLPADLKYFKRITMGKPVLMGRKTHESIAKPLPGRRNIVISHSSNFMAPGCEVVNSLSAAFELCRDAPEIMIIGGAQIYQASLPFAERLYLTLVQADVKGDIFFPKIEANEWQEIFHENHAADEKNPYPYSFVVLDRISRAC